MSEHAMVILKSTVAMDFADTRFSLRVGENRAIWSIWRIPGP